jgi:hypothetical protein
VFLEKIFVPSELLSRIMDADLARLFVPVAELILDLCGAPALFHPVCELTRMNPEAGAEQALNNEPGSYERFCSQMMIQASGARHGRPLAGLLLEGKEG